MHNQCYAQLGLQGSAFKTLEAAEVGWPYDITFRTGKQLYRNQKSRSAGVIQQAIQLPKLLACSFAQSNIA
jgi:hypothetical protein